MLSELYKYDSYLNKNIDVLSNVTIFEYDLKSANTSLCKEYNLLPKERIEEIEKYHKKKRQVIIGKIMQKDKEFKEKFNKCFSLIRERFFEANLVEDKDILSIKKDAIFCLRRMEKTEFGECRFVEKNQFSSYLYLMDTRIEIYYSSINRYMNKDKIEVKGISDDIVKKHDEFMIKFFKNLFYHIETSTKEDLYNFLRNFIDKYKKLELEVGYYREFDQKSIIRLLEMSETYDLVEFIPYDHPTEHINIDYNFFNILLPIVKILI